MPPSRLPLCSGALSCPGARPRSRWSRGASQAAEVVARPTGRRGRGPGPTGELRGGLTAWSSSAGYRRSQDEKSSDGMGGDQCCLRGAHRGQPVPFVWPAWGQLVEPLVICVEVTCYDSADEVKRRWHFQPVGVMCEGSCGAMLCVSHGSLTVRARPPGPALAPGGMQ